MKLLSSDYDGTIRVEDEESFMKNLEHIKQFMQKNIFLLNTGRSFQSIRKEIDENNIPFHYLSCCDGNIIMDKEYNVLYCTSLDNELLSVFDGLKFKYENLTINLVEFRGNIIEFGFVTPNLTDELMNDIEEICKENGLRTSMFKKDGFYEIFANLNSYSKSSAIKAILEREKISYTDIFCIGDDCNDIDMIRDYQGYTFPWGIDTLKELSLDTVDSVYSLIKKIS